MKTRITQSLPATFEVGKNYRVWADDGTRFWDIEVSAVGHYTLRGWYGYNGGPKMEGNFAEVKYYQPLDDPKAYFSLTKDQYDRLEEAMREVGIIPPLELIEIGQVWKHKTTGAEMLIRGYNPTHDGFNEAWVVAVLRNAFIRPKDLRSDYEKVS